jgi:phosphate transport system protein
VKRFESELAALKGRLLEMGRLAEDMAASASNALLTADAASVARVRGDEPTLDRFQIDIDREAIRLITVYAPVARDLRCLLMIARINSEFERIGDEAMDNCRWLETLATGALLPSAHQLAELSSMTLQMLHGAVDAFEQEDIDKARAVIAMDDRIDRIEAKLIRDLADRAPQPTVVAHSVGTVLVARTLERMADHATNIGEEIYYWLEGEDIRHRTADPAPTPG